MALDVGCSTYECTSNIDEKDAGVDTAVRFECGEANTAGTDGEAGDVCDDPNFVLPGETPYCTDGDVWEGDPSYCFIVTNPNCQVDPVDEMDGGGFAILGKSFTGTPDADIDAEEWVSDAFDAARTTWNDAGANVYLRPGELVEEEDVDQTAVNWLEMADDYYHSNDSALAAATMEYNSLEPETGAHGCTITVYAMIADPSNDGIIGYTNWDFTDDEDKMGAEEFSMQSLLLHELGHCLGLGDNDLPDSVMWILPPGTTLSISLDDSQALDFIYG
ncbi:MAG: matrixin family metalloprotease [Deltaproteobacteria bacterium]|nr:matrixin family metalloprotease [Deltaproteobacteria bacterium]